MAAWAAYTYLIEPGRLWAGVAVIAGTVLLVWLLTAAGGRALGDHAGQGAGRPAGALRRGRPADRREARAAAHLRAGGGHAADHRLRCGRPGLDGDDGPVRLAARLARPALPVGGGRRPAGPGRRGDRGRGAAPGREPDRDAAGAGLADAAAPDPHPRPAAARTAAARARRPPRRSRHDRGSAGRWWARRRRAPSRPGRRLRRPHPRPTAPGPGRRRAPAWRAGRSPSTPASSSR